MPTSTLTLPDLGSIDLSQMKPYSRQILMNRGPKEAKPLSKMSRIVSRRQFKLVLAGFPEWQTTFRIGRLEGHEETLVLSANFDPHEKIEFRKSQQIAKLVASAGECILEQLGLTDRADHLCHQGVFVAQIRPTT